MTAVAVITAIYDGFDTLKPTLPQDGVDVDWVLVTDNPPADPLGWQVAHDRMPAMSPSRAAKEPKFRPWEYTDAPASIYLDASFRITSPLFAAGALALADPIAQFAHPWRDCIYDEAQVSVALPKYDGQPVIEQAACYRRLNHPEHWGRWASGVIARRHVPLVKALGDLWAVETDAWTLQCQVSEPWVLRNLGLRPASLPGDHFTNPWLAYEGSGRH